MKTYQYGNTVRLECAFHDFEGKKVDPQIVKVIIYNHLHKKIHEGVGTRKGVGEYYYDYTTEGKQGRVIYEWYGEIDGKASLKREQFVVKFI